MSSIDHDTLKALGTVKFFTEEEEAKLVDAARAGDEEARNSLVYSMIPLALKISKPYFFVDAQREDVVQEVFMTVCSAVEHYRPGKGRLSSYVKKAIRNQMSQRIGRKRPRFVQASKHVLDAIAQLGVPHDEATSEADHRKCRQKMILNIAKRILTDRQLYVFTQRQAGRKVADLAEEMEICRQRVEQLYKISVRKIKRDILPEPST